MKDETRAVLSAVGFGFLAGVATWAVIAGTPRALGWSGCVTGILTFAVGPIAALIAGVATGTKVYEVLEAEAAHRAEAPTRGNHDIVCAIC